MVTATFTFDEGGRILVSLNVNAFDVELFAEPMDFFRLVLEGLFLIFLIVQIVNEIVEMFTLARGEDKRWSEPFAYCGVIGFRTGSFHFTLNGFWNLFDLMAIVMFITYFVAWYIYIIFFANEFAPQLRYEVYSDLGAKGGILSVNESGLKDMTGLFDACDKLNAHIQCVFSHRGRLCSLISSAGSPQTLVLSLPSRLDPWLSSVSSTSSRSF
jgi:hypothetical protein